jgi:hypothetical protein
MMIDCDSCTVRGAACTDCVVTFLTIPVRPSAGRGSPAGPGAAAPGRTTSEGSGSGLSAPAVGAGPGAFVDLDDGERAAIGVLAASGLVPPLRMERAM